MKLKLRFKEFSGDWEEKKLKDVTTYVDYRGKTPKKTLDGIFLITAKNIKNGYIDYDCSKEYIAEDDFENVMSRGFANIGDVLITTEAPCGNVAQVDRINIALAQRIIKLSGVDNLIDNTYLKYELLSPTFQEKLDKLSTGGTVKGIKGAVLHKMDIYFPSLPEQTKIADFLSTVDEKIQNQQDKITHLENIKKGFMQKIFSRKIRFKDANGNDFPNWEETTIGKSGYFYYGKSAPKWSIKEDATTPCIRYGELYTTHNIIVKNIKSYTNIDKENLKFSKGNEVLVPRVGEEPLDFCKCCYLPFPNIAIGEMISVYNTENNPLFISYLFNATMKYEFARRVEGGNVSNLYFVYLENIPMMLPCLEEQQKIADFLSSFDDKIDAEKETLEHLKELKKGLLQQMFV